MKSSVIPTGYEVERAPELVWMLWRGEKSHATAGYQTLIHLSSFF
jgi:hypothetical protein